ncbi:MAG: glycosyltransferase family 2 protein [Chloroflexota bacterium]|jgi:N-acetylglucosaminyl-diphospho-decaprenol L-rhamnosyltransferase
MNLSIIIVSWNTQPLLRRCLESVYDGLLNCKFEMLVVDNSSFDGSVQMVREKFPDVRLIENHENVGFARANNQAIKASAGRYLLLLNPDTEVQPGALESLVSFMEEHPFVGAAGAKLLNPDGTLQISCFPTPTLPRELWRLFHLDLLHPYACYPTNIWCTQAPLEVETAQGACLILRREALEQVGLLDEEYFIYSEEVDLCYRLRRQGWKVYWVPQAEVVHHGGQSTRQVASRMFLHLYQGKILFFRKHHCHTAAQLYKLILLSAASVRLLLIPLACFLFFPKRQQLISLTSNYWQLIQVLVHL